MHRLSPNSLVRRRLFQDESPEEAELDNYTNILQEQVIRANREQARKWNFDFENERPLEGTYEWTPIDDNDVGYIGKVRTNEEAAGESAEVDMEAEEEENVRLLQKKNETTPAKKTEADTPLLRGKDENAKTVEARRLQFD